MADAHPTSGITTGVLPIQDKVDALQKEVNDLRAIVESLIKEIEELKKVKIETVSGALLYFPSPASNVAMQTRPQCGFPLWRLKSRVSR